MKLTKVILPLVMLASLQVPMVKANGVSLSPNKAEVSTFDTLTWKQLRHDRSGDSLIVSLGFSNEHYASDTEIRRDERYDFVLPNVRFDKASNTFRVTNAKGREEVVAVDEHGLRGVKLAPSARICIYRRGAQLKVGLESLGSEVDGEQWVEIHRMP